MSFILDALKKSETSRQQQSGPAFAEVPTGRRHATRPWWAVGVATLLVLNLVVLAVVLLRDAPQPRMAPPVVPPPTTRDTIAAGSTPAQQSNETQRDRAVTAGSAKLQPATRQLTETNVDSPVQPVPAATSSLAAAGPARDPAVRSLAEEAFGGGLAPYEESETGAPSDERELAPAAAVPSGPPAVRPVDVAPAVASQPSYPQNLPTMNELALQGAPGLPEIHLDIHVYSTNPAERFVFINLRKYVEGQALKEGPTVEQITRDGVILNDRGTRFLLPRQ